MASVPSSPLSPEHAVPIVSSAIGSVAPLGDSNAALSLILRDAHRREPDLLRLRLRPQSLLLLLLLGRLKMSA